MGKHQIIAIIDYGMGNLASIRNMLSKLHFASVITADIALIKEADKLIIPGVGAFDNAVRQLRERDLIEVLNENVIIGKKPLYPSDCLFKTLIGMLPLFALVNLEKILRAPVIGPFEGVREKTRGELSSAFMVAETFAADSFSAAGICAVTRKFVFLYLTFHHRHPAPTIFLNSFSSMRVRPSFFAFSYFEPGSVPTTT